MMDRLLTLEEVERLLTERSSARVFSTKLNEKFEADTGPRRAKLLRASVLRTALVYNVFLVGDLYLARDALQLAVTLHLAVVTPYMFLVAWLLPRVRAPMRESLVASISVAMVLQILAVFCVTKSPYAAHYLYFVPSTVLSLNSIQRWRVDQAHVAAALNFVLLLAAFWYRGGEPIEIVAMHTMNYAICVAVTLRSNLEVEQEQRWHYLVALRERLRAQESADDANHDPLTGLGNRRYLEKCASELWSVGAAEDRSVAAIAFDVDHFKDFNDFYGHTRGDSCLKRVAACATAELRDARDLAFRVGGEEFLLLLPNTELEAAIGVAERVRNAIAGLGIPHADSNTADYVTASFGVAAAQVGAVSLSDLLDTADGALYAAKRGGRNRTRAQAKQSADRAA